MIRREEGFTLVELMITMVVFVLVIAAASSIFSSLLNQFKQQSKVIESNIEGVVGLDMMRVDVQEAGFGLPWVVDSNGDGVVDSSDSWGALDRYLEAVGSDNTDPADPLYYNDGDTASALPLDASLRPAMQRAPRAVIAQNRIGIMENTLNTPLSDYLVVKSTSLGLGAAVQKWTYVTRNDATGNVTAHWDDPNEDLNNDDWVITQRPVLGTDHMVLVMAAPPTFSTTFATAYPPELDGDTHLIYGVGPASPRAPFNRADFYVGTPVDNMPAKCAPNTGILYKAVMKNDGMFTVLPLLDCVADMQVVFITVDPLEPINKPPVLSDANFIVGLTAEQIRAQVRGVEVFILAQEGQRDPNFTFNNFTTAANSGIACAGVANCMRVGYRDAGGLYGREFDLSLIGPTFVNYRWKVYQFAVQPPNLRLTR